MTAQSVAQRRPGTFSALRSANFRLYFVGQLISISGTWMQTIAQGYLVFQLTKSEAWLGIVACAAGLPVVLLAPVSGAIVEHIPRRPLILWTQAAQMVLAFILAALAFSGAITVWEIVVLAFLLGVTNAIYEPARQIFIVEVVGPDELRSGITAHSIMNSGARVAGPALAGLALAQFGAAWCFLINALSFLAVIAMLWLMKVPYPMTQIRSTNPLRQMKEGYDFARAHNQIAPLLLLALIGSIFVVPIAQLLPAFADVVLHSPDQGYAAMTAGTGVGSVVAGLGVAWLAHRLGFGRIIALSVVGGALATALMAVQSLVFPAAFFATWTGVFMTLFYIGINTDVQMAVPDAYRGRVMSIYTLTYLGIAPFGALALGFIANGIGTVASLVLWGIAGGVLGGIVLLRWPHLLRKAVPQIA
jgi:MFS family permease